MEKYREQIQQSLELTQTGLEGLQHIQKLYSEGKFEDSFLLFNDVVQAFATVEQSLNDYLDQLPTNDLQDLTTSLRNAIDLVVGTYEHNDLAKAQEIMQFILLPQYKKWKTELERVLTPYIVS